MRRLLVWSGAVLGMVGVGLIVTLPVQGPLRGLLALVWSASVLREILFLRHAWARCRRIRVAADGGVSLLDDDDEWRPAELLTGGILLRRIGWIRLRAAGEPAFGELLRGSRRDDRDWRRLHVIWRHIGA